MALALQSWRVPNWRRAWLNTLSEAGLHESSAFLRRSRDANQGGRRERPEAHGDDWLPAHHLARHEVLRPLRAQGLRAVPRISRRRHQKLFPELQRDPLERLRVV